MKVSIAGHPQNPTGSHTPEVHIKREAFQNRGFVSGGDLYLKNVEKVKYSLVEIWLQEQRMKGIKFLFQQAQGINQNLKKWTGAPIHPSFAGISQMFVFGENDGGE